MWKSNRGAWVIPPRLLPWHSIVPSVKNGKWFFLFLNSHWRCSVKKCVLRNFAIFTGKHLCQSLFLNKVAALRCADQLTGFYIRGNTGIYWVKGYLREKTTTSQNLPSEAQVKNFLFRGKVMFHSRGTKVYVFSAIPWRHDKC